MTSTADFKTGEIAVSFAGADAGEAELTWGQREIWASFELQGQTLGIGGTMEMPPGTTVDEFVAVLRLAMSRHQSLRTRFHCDEYGHPVTQSVAASGEVALEVFDVPDGIDSGAFATTLALEYEQRQYDYATEWPIRMAVVRQGNHPTHAVVMYCHLVIDGFGLDALNRDMAGRVMVNPSDAPTDGVQPLEQARQQSTPAGRRQSESALSHWERLLRTVPMHRSRHASPITPSTRDARYWQAGIRSPAMHLAMTAIAGRMQVDTSPVLMAAFAVSLAQVSGVNPSVIRTVVSNRFRPGFAESVSVVNQTGLCVIDVAGTTFDQVVLRTWRSSLGAGMHAYYDPRALKQLFAKVGAERGGPLDMACFFNDARRTRHAVGASTPNETDVRDALTRTEFRWVYRRATPNERIFMAVNEAVDTVDFWLCADTCYWPPEDLEACARNIETVLVDAAFDPNASTGVGVVGAGRQ